GLRRLRAGLRRPRGDRGADGRLRPRPSPGPRLGQGRGHRPAHGPRAARPRHHRGRPPRRPTGAGMTDVTLTNIIAGEETGAAGRMELVDPATGEVYGTAP